MCFEVTAECVALGLRAGAVLFRGVYIGPASPELRAEIAREAAAIRQRYAAAAEVRADPLVASFHDVLKRVGVNPRRDQPSIDRLLTFALKRGDLPTINCLVDAYNLVSIRSRCSLGAHDIDRIQLPVTLRLLTGTESFTPLGGTEAQSVTAGEYGYVDAANRLLCRLDVVQADFSKVTEQTTNALLIIEATMAHAAVQVRQVFTSAIETVTRYCGGTGEIFASTMF